MADGLIDRLRWNPDTPFMDEDVGAIHNAGLDDLRDLLRSPETREALAAASVAVLNEHGLSGGGELHSWRCLEGDRYGPCTCVEELASDLTAAVGRVLTGEAGD